MAIALCLGEDFSSFQSSHMQSQQQATLGLQTFSLEFDASFITLLHCQMLQWLWSSQLTLVKLRRAVDVRLMQNI